MGLSSYCDSGVLQRESATHNASLPQPAPKSLGYLIRDDPYQWATLRAGQRKRLVLGLSPRPAQPRRFVDTWTWGRGDNETCA